MFDRFTDRAKKTMSLSRHEAMQLGHDYIAPEHMLLGLLQTDGVAVNVLRNLGVELDALRTSILGATRRGATQIPAQAQLPFTPAAKRVLEHALEESSRFAHNYIGSEHLLLALLRTEGTIAAQALTATRLETLRTEIAEFLGEGPGQPTPAPDRSKLRALLISNSTMHGGGYLEHCASTIRDFLGAKQRVLFVPYALADHDGYAAKASAAFAAMGHELTSVHTSMNKVLAVLDAGAIFIGGGNTFRLLKALYDHRLLDPIHRRCLAGLPYIGSSAGTNVATLSIRTTNDMPIVQPPAFAALQLVPLQINPHYLDPDPGSKHMGETREERLRQFHEEDATPVLALREGCMLRVEGTRAELLGTTRARLFLRGQEPREFTPPSDLSFLVQSTPA